MQAYKRKRFKNIKPQNRLRIVFWEEDGKPISYIHIEESEAKTFLKVFKEINQSQDWIWIQELGKRLNIPRVSLTWAVIRMAGARYVDIQQKGAYQRLVTGPLLLVKKGRIHRNVQRGFEKPYKHPPIYIKSARKATP